MNLTSDSETSAEFCSKKAIQEALLEYRLSLLLFLLFLLKIFNPLETLLMKYKQSFKIRQTQKTMKDIF